jgi:hypothetical protein
MGCTKDITHMIIIYMYKTVVRKPGRRRPLERHGNRYEDNIKMDILNNLSRMWWCLPVSSGTVLCPVAGCDEHEVETLGFIKSPGNFCTGKLL